MTQPTDLPQIDTAKFKKDKSGNRFRFEPSAEGGGTLYFITKDGRELHNSAESEEAALANITAYLKQ